LSRRRAELWDFRLPHGSRQGKHHLKMRLEEDMFPNSSAGRLERLIYATGWSETGEEECPLSGCFTPLFVSDLTKMLGFRCS